MNVAPEIRERVLACAKEYDYQPNVLAKGLQGSKTHLLGVLLTDISNGFFAISVIVIMSYTIEYVITINKFTISYFIHGFNLLDAQKTMDILCILLMMDFVTKEISKDLKESGDIDFYV